MAKVRCGVIGCDKPPVNKVDLLDPKDDYKIDVTLLVCDRHWNELDQGMTLHFEATDGKQLHVKLK